MREVVFGASYLVLGLGDVYMGAPVAVPLDPRHRLVTTKYNPARTWTPPNAVGIGGAFLCVYGMEGPGGYQLVGRTVPIWHDGDDPPWRLRHFDELRFEPVAAERARRAARRQRCRNVGAARRAGRLLAGRARALPRRQRRRHRGVPHAARDRVRTPSAKRGPATPRSYDTTDPARPAGDAGDRPLGLLRSVAGARADRPLRRPRADRGAHPSRRRRARPADGRGDRARLRRGRRPRPRPAPADRPDRRRRRAPRRHAAGRHPRAPRRACATARTSPATGAICTRTSARSA